MRVWVEVVSGLVTVMRLRRPFQLQGRQVRQSGIVYMK